MNYTLLPQDFSKNDTQSVSKFQDLLLLFYNPLSYIPIMEEIKIGIQVKKLRKLRKMSQMDLELEAKLAFGTISRIENQKTNPTKETLFRITQILKLNEEEFLQLMGFEHLTN